MCKTVILQPISHSCVKSRKIIYVNGFAVNVDLEEQSVETLEGQESPKR